MPGLALSSNVILMPLRPPRSSVPVKELSLAEIQRYAFPGPHWGALVEWKRQNLPHIFRGLKRIVAARQLGIPHLYGQLCYVSVDPDGTRRDYGLVSLRVITTVGATAIVAGFVSGAAINTFKYHGLGTGGAVEAVGDIALGNELSTYYSPASTRTTGTQVAYSSVIYQTVAGVTLTSALTVSEHGLFSQAATGGGTLLDRSLTASTPVAGGGSLSCDYRLTIGAGS